MSKHNGNATWKTIPAGCCQPQPYGGKEVTNKTLQDWTLDQLLSECRARGVVEYRRPEVERKPADTQQDFPTTLCEALGANKRAYTMDIPELGMSVEIDLLSVTEIVPQLPNSDLVDITLVGINGTKVKFGIPARYGKALYKARQDLNIFG